MKQIENERPDKPINPVPASGLAGPVTGSGSCPPPEDEFGGGDICSPEKTSPTDDDIPLP